VDVIVVDDGSTDDTRERIERRYGQDHRVRYFHQDNQGVSVARNRGLREVRGSYVALLDSDDLWKPWKLELQLACLERLPHAGMIWTDMEAVDAEGRTVDRAYLHKYYSAYRWFTDEQLFTESYPLPRISVELPEQVTTPRLLVGDIFSPMIMGNLVHTPTVLLRRERLEQVKGFNEELRGSGGDYDFHLRTCRQGPVAFVRAACIEYRAGAADQLTQPSFAIHRARNFLRTISPFIDQERDRIRLPDQMVSAVLAEAHEWIGEAAFNLGEYGEARSHLAESLGHRPWQLRTTALLLASLLPSGSIPGLRQLYRTAKRRLWQPWLGPPPAT
jgi:GT2 family glycosyltransferase